MRVPGWGRERERERERIPSRLCVVSAEPDAGLSLMNREIMTRAEIESRTLNRLSHPGASVSVFFVTRVSSSSPLLFYVLPSFPPFFLSSISLFLASLDVGAKKDLQSPSPPAETPR